MVPGPTSLTAYELTTRAMTRSTAIAKPGYTDGPVLLAEAGSTLIAQWGATVQAYRAA